MSTIAAYWREQARLGEAFDAALDIEEDETHDDAETTHECDSGPMDCPECIAESEEN